MAKLLRPTLVDDGHARAAAAEAAVLTGLTHPVGAAALDPAAHVAAACCLDVKPRNVIIAARPTSAWAAGPAGKEVEGPPDKVSGHTPGPRHDGGGERGDA